MHGFTSGMQKIRGSRVALYRSRMGISNKPRNVRVDLIRHLRNDALKQVGEQFGTKKYSTVSSIVERFNLSNLQL